MKKKPFSEIPRLEDGRLLLRAITPADADALAALAGSARVYRYLPTFLYGQKYPDIRRVIDGLYAECLQESLILGGFLRDDCRFCGLAEMYGSRTTSTRSAWATGCWSAAGAKGSPVRLWG